MWPLPLDLKIPPSAYSNKIKVSVSAFAYALQSRQICDKNEYKHKPMFQRFHWVGNYQCCMVIKMENDNRPLYRGSQLCITSVLKKYMKQ